VSALLSKILKIICLSNQRHLPILNYVLSREILF